MDGMEEKLGAILNNPQMMQQIMSLAQSLNQTPPPKEPPRTVQKKQQPGMDLNALSKIAGLSSQGNLDNDQRALIHAMSPYLSREKLNKLERAMRAARLARAASSFLNAGGLQMLTGR